ncbi:unnamed protein product, partial [Ectocarpus sp. 12 AP-2014]
MEVSARAARQDGLRVASVVPRTRPQEPEQRLFSFCSSNTPRDLSEVSRPISAPAVSFAVRRDPVTSLAPLRLLQFSLRVNHQAIDYTSLVSGRGRPNSYILLHTDLVGILTKLQYSLSSYVCGWKWRGGAVGLGVFSVSRASGRGTLFCDHGLEHAARKCS